MSAEEKKRTYSLDDYSDFLSSLESGGLEVMVIGGIAVGAYGRLNRETILSADLDVYTTIDTQIQVLDWAPRNGIKVAKRPQPRALPVAFLQWQGKEINVLTETKGLPPPAEAFQEGRVFHLKEHGDLEVLVADPYDLLRCKLEVNRPKDRPHQEVLRRFLEEEVVESFRVETKPRDRIAPAQRLLEVLGARYLPEGLALRLLPHARLPSDFRFLLGRAPTGEFAEAVLRALPEALGLREELERIRDRRQT